MASTMMLSVLTPERLFFSAPVEKAIFTSTDGEIGVLPRHANMVAALVSGEMIIYSENAWRTAFVSDGVLSVVDGECVVLCQSANWPEELSLTRIEESRLRAQEALRQARSQREYVEGKAALTRAMVRLRIKSSSSMGPHT